MTTTTYAEPLVVIGLPLRTSNAEAFETIPPHWAAFSSTDVAARIGSTQSPDVLAVYADHERPGDNTGRYTFLIGYAVPPGTEVPEGLARVEVPASPRVVVPVERPELVGAAWQEIWSRDDLDATYVADYERYLPDGTVEISVGVGGPLP